MEPYMEYKIKEPSLKKGNQKDASAYSEKVASVAPRKSAPLDAKGQTGKKDESPYKEHCKDE
jgi:hypothetical protein